MLTICNTAESIIAPQVLRDIKHLRVTLCSIGPWIAKLSQQIFCFTVQLIKSHSFCSLLKLQFSDEKKKTKKKNIAHTLQSQQHHTHQVGPKHQGKSSGHERAWSATASDWLTGEVQPRPHPPLSAECLEESTQPLKQRAI